MLLLWVCCEIIGEPNFSIAPYCAGCLAIAGPDYDQDPEYAHQLAQDPAVAAWPLIFLVEDPRVVERNITFLWSTFTRFEPAGDIHAAGSRTHRHHEIFEAPIVFDCRMKPGYPDELFADDDTVNKVSRRWTEYFPEGNVEGEADPLGYVGFQRMR